MSAVLNTLNRSIFQEILFHPSWLGNIAGLAAEKMLRGQKAPFLYIMRQGESSNLKDEMNFYLTFVTEDLSVKHQPFTITLTPESWYYENGGTGPIDTSINEVLHLIMHCQKDQCASFVK